MMRKKLFPEVKFSCRSDEIVIFEHQSNPLVVKEFLEQNKTDILSTKTEKPSPKTKFLHVKVDPSKSPQLCVRLGMYNLE